MTQPVPEPDDGAVNLGGFGKIDMYPAAAYEAARLVHGAGRSFGAAWPGLRGSIETQESALGNGPLGEAFRIDYNAFADAVTPAADRVPEMFQGLGEAGAKAVAHYVEIDGQVGARFGSFE